MFVGKLTTAHDRPASIESWSSADVWKGTIPFFSTKRYPGSFVEKKGIVPFQTSTHEPSLQGDHGSVCAVVGLKLREDPVDVGFHRGLGDP
jgi:hypothetical protein